MPAPLPTTEQCIKATLKFDLGTSELYGFSFAMFNAVVGPTTAQLLSTAGAIEGQFGADLASLMSSAFTLKSVTVFDLKHPATVEGVQPSTTVGTRSGTALPASACTAITLLPDRRYRGARPKLFTPFGVEGDQATSQHWGGAYLSNVVSTWDGFIDDVVANDAGGSQVTALACIFRTGPPYEVVSNSGLTRSHSVGTPLDPPLVTSVIESVANPKIASQRRRLGKPF